MLHGLLIDRLKLKTHAENREVTVHVLTVDDSKPKLTLATDSEPSACKPDPTAPKPIASNPNQPPGTCRKAAEPNGISPFYAVEKESRPEASETNAIHSGDSCRSCD
jgi:uncharacterized protein (TIGR03435 family)